MSKVLKDQINKEFISINLNKQSNKNKSNLDKQLNKNKSNLKIDKFKFIDNIMKK